MMNCKEKLLKLFHRVNKLTPPIFVAGFVFLATVVCLIILILQKPTEEQGVKVSAADLAADLFPESAALTGEYPAFPEISFDGYELNTSIPVTPAAVNIYSFKANYTLPEALEFAKKFDFNNLNQKEVSETTTVIYDNQTQESRGILIFDHQTGSFSFQSFGVHKPKEVTEFATPESIAQTYLSELGLWDETLIFTTTYQREEIVGAVFVEFHRDWNKVGLPILNIVGSLNAPENTRLVDAKLASQVSNLPDDPSIINVMNGLEGKERPVDFNTITVGVGDDGRILFIDSNLRQFTAINSTTNLNFTLKTPQEALDEVKQGKGIFSLTAPSGEGTLDFAKVYPDNTAHGEKATINDFVLAYLEKANGIEQKFLQPMYIFRGTSTLDSGYNVQFAQAVPAVKVNTAAGNFEKKLKNFTDKIAPTAFAYIVGPHFEIPGLGEVAMSARGKFYYIPKTTEDESRSIDEIRTLFFDALSDQHTINVSRKLLADETLRTFVEGNPLTEEYIFELFNKINGLSIYHTDCCSFERYDAPIIATNCSDITKWDYFINQMDYVAKRTAQNLIEIFTEPTPIPTLTPTPTFTPTPSPTATPVPTLTPTPTPEIFEPLGAQTTMNRLQIWAEKPDIFPENTITLTLFRNPYGSTPPECYQVGSSYDQTVCYITGTETSPAIYLYPDVPKNVTVKVRPASKITYADPEPLNEECQMWEVSASPDGKINSNGIFRSRLYYEYEKINFPEPKEGWIIESNELDNFLKEKLFSQLNLNQKEANDLLTDAHTSLTRVKPSVYLKISLLDKPLLDKYLPLNIFPTPNHIYRIHLILTPLEEPVECPEPEITTIVRSGFTVVETGVVIND